MENNIVISVGKNNYDTLISVNGEPIGCIVDLNFYASADNVMPVLHITTYAPNKEMPIQLQQSLENNIKLLQSIPYVKLNLMEINHE